jgi:lipoic acid synthetase
MSSPVIQIGEGTKAFSHRRLPSYCYRPPRPNSAMAGHAKRLREAGLASVCEEARCPNRGECWERGHVTIMLMGDVCTRACRFCAVATGKPVLPPSPDEPREVARLAQEGNWAHVVLTSVNRDDLPDGGAAHFAQVIEALHDSRPQATVEVLTPDFQGDAEAVRTVINAGPDVFNHNVETIPRLYREVRPGARFQRSLDVLAHAKQVRPQTIVKSGLMLGLGETAEEVLEVLAALRAHGVDTLTLGQYLRPSRTHLAVQRYWEPAEFHDLAEEGMRLGFQHIASGPLVRSSYNAEATLQAIRADRQELLIST